MKNLSTYISTLAIILVTWLAGFSQVPVISLWTSTGANLNWNDQNGFNPAWNDGNIASFGTTATVVTNNDYSVSGLNFSNSVTYSVSGLGKLIFSTSTPVISIPGSGATMNLASPIVSLYPITFSGGTNINSVVNLNSPANTLTGLVVTGTMRLNVNNSGAAGQATIASLPNSVLRFSNANTFSGNITIPSNFILNGAKTSLGATNPVTLVYTGIIGGSSDIYWGNDPTGTGGGGVTIINNKNIYTGASYISGTNASSVKLGTDNALPSISGVYFNGTGGIDLNGFSQAFALLSSSGTNNGIINTGSSAALVLINGSQNSVFTRNISDNPTLGGATVGLVKSGTGSLTLTANTTFTGGTTLLGGALYINGSGKLAPANTVEVVNGYLGGTGAIRGTVNLLTNDVSISPGSGPNTIGSLTVGSLNLYGGSSYAVNLNSVATLPGVNQDIINVLNNLNFSAGSSNPVIFNIIAPTIAGFINTNNYVWNIISLTGSGSISNYNAAIVSITSRNFGPVPGGLFTIATTTGAVQLVYTPDAVDVTAPVATFSPQNGATSITGVIRPAITFYEDIVSVNGIALDNTNIANAFVLKLDNASGADVSFTASVTGTTVTIIPATTLGPPGQAFYLGLPANSIRDVAGNMAPAQGIVFTIANTPPVIAAVNTSTYLLNLSATTMGYATATIGDPSDPLGLYGFDFSINDAETAASALTVTGISSNINVIGNDSFTITGTGSTRNVKFTPVGIGYSDVTITVTDGKATGSYVIKMAVSADNPVGEYTFFWYTGTQETSSAQAIDANYMITEDDENNVLKVYNRHASGLPVATFDIGTYLTGSTGKNDIEASVSIPGTNKIYWTSSYSNTSSGNNDANRRYLFVTSTTGSGSTTGIVFGRFYNNLRQDLINWDNANGSILGFNAGAAAGVASEVINGFNVEGMVLAPNNTDLYLCFRAPQLTATGSSMRDRALVVSIAGFEAGFANGSFPASVFNYFTLDLGGRVIREIKKNTNNDYLISAGPTSGDTPAFALFTWDGNPASQPMLRDCDLATLNNNHFNSMGSYESIVEVPNPLLPTSQVQLLQDDGDSDFFTQSGQSYKGENSNWMKFRSDIFTLGKYVQAISFPAISDVWLNPSTTTGIILNATATSGLAVNYTIASNPANIVSIYNGNMVSITGFGSVTISGWQTGDNNWGVAPGVGRSFMIYGAATPAITFVGATLTVGGANIDLSNAFSTNSTGTKSFSISDAGIASLSGHNLVAVSAGIVTVTGYVASTPVYNGAQTFAVFTVTNSHISCVTGFIYINATTTVGGIYNLEPGNKYVLDNSALATIAGSTLTALETGILEIQYVDLISNCPGNIVSLTITGGPVTSVENQLSGQSLAIYPNPVIVGNKINFTKIVSVSVFNTVGYEVLKANEIKTLDVSTLSRGVYIIRTKANEFAKLLIE